MQGRWRWTLTYQSIVRRSWKHFWRNKSQMAHTGEPNGESQGTDESCVNDCDGYTRDISSALGIHENDWNILNNILYQKICSISFGVCGIILIGLIGLIASIYHSVDGDLPIARSHNGLSQNLICRASPRARLFQFTDRQNYTLYNIYIRIYTCMYVYIILYSNIYTYILYRSTHTVKHMSIHIRWIGRAFLDGATLWRHFLPINSYKQLSFCLADSWELSVTDFSHCNVSDPIIKYTVKDLPQGTAQSESESTRPGKIEWAAIDEDRRKYGCQAGGSTRSRSNNCMDFF